MTQSIISPAINRILTYIEDEEKSGKYTPLSLTDSKLIRDYYQSLLTIPLGRTTANILNDMHMLAVGYERVVIGDYGAYLEIAEDKMLISSLRCRPGQEYRMDDPRYKDHVKYWWLQPVGGAEIKVYFQLKTVKYADYRPGMFYISPHAEGLKINIGEA